MAEQSIALFCDDSYFSLLATAEELEENPDALMSDAKYAEELQFQEAIHRSILISVSNGAESSVKTEVGESSGTKEVCESSDLLCEICTEKKENEDMFSVKNCTHRYCTDCIAKHIVVKVEKTPVDSKVPVLAFDCPGLDCKGVLEIESCRGLIPKYVVGLWDDVICESMIDSSQKFYCPYKDCSGLIVNDAVDEVICSSECPFCHRLFCAQCEVPWHSGFECVDFQKLSKDERGREDLMMHELAKENKWQRCPRCKFVVEKNGGCLHMTCRCGYQFCYACGAVWTSTHGGCQ